MQALTLEKEGVETIPFGSSSELFGAKRLAPHFSLRNGDDIVHPPRQLEDKCNQWVVGSNPPRRAFKKHWHLPVFFVIFNNMSKWQKYYDDTKNKQPAKILVEALSFVENKNRALDLGAGALVDSGYLLSLGFEVVAVDREKFPEQIVDEKFSFVQSSYNDYEFPEDSFDLISAQFSLPFNGADGFEVLWQKIISSLKPGGVFVGQLFGLNDEWNNSETKLVFHSKKQVEDLFAGLEILKLVEIERDGKLASGEPKHWHLFNIIVRKKA